MSHEMWGGELRMQTGLLQFGERIEDRDIMMVELVRSWSALQLSVKAVEIAACRGAWDRDPRVRGNESLRGDYCGYWASRRRARVWNSALWW